LGVGVGWGGVRFGLALGGVWLGGVGVGVGWDPLPLPCHTHHNRLGGAGPPLTRQAGLAHHWQDVVGDAVNHLWGVGLVFDRGLRF
jgi:hypothetical protein